MTTVLKVSGHSEYRQSHITRPIPLPIQSSNHNFYEIKMASEDGKGSDVEHKYKLLSFATFG